MLGYKMPGYCDKCHSLLPTSTDPYYVCTHCGFSNGSMGRTDGGSSTGCAGWLDKSLPIAKRIEPDIYYIDIRTGRKYTETEYEILKMDIKAKEFSLGEETIEDWRKHCGSGGVAILKDYTKPDVVYCKECKYENTFTCPMWSLIMNGCAPLTYCSFGRRSE